MAKESLILTPMDPVYRIPDTEVDADFLVQRAMDKMSQFENDRTTWMERRAEFYMNWDDYLSPIYKGAWEGSANYHLPVTEIKAQAMHAMILQSIFGLPIPFYVDPEEESDLERIQKIERKMKYICMRYANYNEGIYNAIDDWAWDLVTGGVGILSRDWRVDQRRFLTIDESPEFQEHLYKIDSLLADDVDESTFDEAMREMVKKPFKETMKVRTVFNGPIVRAENPEYILFKGDVADSTDLNLHETVIKVCYFSPNELKAFKATGYMDEEAVDMVLSQPPERKASTLVRNARNRYLRDMITGINTDGSYVEDKYEFFMVYDTVNPKNDNKRLADRLVHITHPKTRTLMRWTFLDRISSLGKLPLHMCHLYRRPRRSIGRGIVETMHTTNTIQDILVNQSIDAGMLANNPMGAYKGMSTFDPGELRAEPGLWMKTDDPNNDLRILNWPINPNWSMQLQGLLSSIGDQQVALGPSQMGQVGNRVGPLRSTSGIRELNQGSDMILNVIMRRVSQCLSGFYEGLFADCTQRMPESLEIAVIGMDGIPELDDSGRPIREVISKADLRGRVHFGLMANSENMNPQKRLQDSIQMTQFLFQQATMGTGVVKPNNIYESCKEVLKDMGKMRIDRFLSRPDGSGVLAPLQELIMVMQGLTPVVMLEDPAHEEKIELYDQILSSEQAQLEVKYGHVAQNALQIAKIVRDKHEQFLKVLQAKSALANPTGMQKSPTAGLQNGQMPNQEQPVNQNQTQNLTINNGEQEEGPTLQ
jgi:hypothetical protein